MRIRKISFLTVLLCILSLVPPVIIGMYDFPAADDFSMGLEAGRAFRETGSVWAAVTAAFGKTIKLYNTWIGYFSSSFLSALPPHTWGEGFYRLTFLISCGMFAVGTAFFLYTVLVRIHKAEPAVFAAICAVTVFASVQCMPEGAPRVEGFYWFSGSINYTFMYGVALCWVSVLMRYYLRGRKGSLAASVILGFITGGANYMTSLSATMVSALILVRLSYDSRIKKADQSSLRKKWLILPVAAEVCAFVLSCTAPGNRVRGSLTEGLPAVKTVLLSMFYVLKYCIGSWTGWTVILLLTALIPLMWRAVSRTDYDFRLPAVFVIFAWGFAAANIAPPLYATGNIEAGRIQALFWLQYILLLVLSEWYVTGWVRKRLAGEGALADRLKLLTDKYERGFYVLVCLVFVAGSLLSVKLDREYYTASAALRDLVNGNASSYAAENRERLALLTDPDTEKVKLPPHESRPSLLFFSDITDDPSDWSNQAVASYYAKKSVKLH